MTIGLVLYGVVALIIWVVATREHFRDHPGGSDALAMAALMGFVVGLTWPGAGLVTVIIWTFTLLGQAVHLGRQVASPVVGAYRRPPLRIGFSGWPFPSSSTS